MFLLPNWPHKLPFLESNKMCTYLSMVFVNQDGNSRVSRWKFFVEKSCSTHICFCDQTIAKKKMKFYRLKNRKRFMYRSMCLWIHSTGTDFFLYKNRINQKWCLMLCCVRCTSAHTRHQRERHCRLLFIFLSLRVSTQLSNWKWSERVLFILYHIGCLRGWVETTSFG